MNSTAIITGAASGIGRACAMQMKDKHHLLLTDINEKLLSKTAKELQKSGASVSVQVSDLSDLDSIALLVKAAIEIGPIGALIHSGGLSPKMADGKLIYKVNLIGSAYLLERLTENLPDGNVHKLSAVLIASQAAHMIASKRSSEINALLESPLGLDFFEKIEELQENAFNSDTAYGLSKLGIILLVRKYAPIWGNKNNRIVSISPGIIDTPMGRFEYERQPIMEQMVELTALQRKGRPEEIAAVADFLCSEQASFVTGIDLLVDGGATHAILKQFSDQ